MTNFHLARPALTSGFVLTLAGCLALSAPQAASAKTFVARLKDKSGDAAKGSTDITKARIAYNRKSGAVSISVTMKDAIDASNDDGVVSVIFSDLKNGKCQKATMAATTLLSAPGDAYAYTIKGTKAGATRVGTSSIEGNELTMRIKHRSLAGRTPGCTYAAIHTNEDDVELLDETKGNDGFV